MIYHILIIILYYIEITCILYFLASVEYTIQHEEQLTPLYIVIVDSSIALLFLKTEKDLYIAFNNVNIVCTL